MIAAEAAVIPLALLIAPVGLTLAAVLLLAFAATIIVTLQRGARPTCRCFGAKSAPLRGAHVARNVVLAALAAAGLFAGDHAFAGAPLAVGAILAAVALLVLVRSTISSSPGPEESLKIRWKSSSRSWRCSRSPTSG